MTEGFVGVAKGCRNEFVEDDTADSRLDDVVFLEREELDLFASLDIDFDIAIVVGHFANAGAILFDSAHVNLATGLELEIDVRVQIDSAVFVSADSFGSIVEVHAFALAVRTRLGQVVEP